MVNWNAINSPKAKRRRIGTLPSVLCAVSVFGASLTLTAVPVDAATLTFVYTGATIANAYTVPQGVCALVVDAAGGNGGGNSGGGTINATIPVSPGESLDVTVGGAGGLITGGFDTGGTGTVAVVSGNVSWGGGGATVLWRGGVPAVVAGGSGGNASSYYAPFGFPGTVGGVGGSGSNLAGGTGGQMPWPNQDLIFGSPGGVNVLPWPGVTAMHGDNAGTDYWDAPSGGGGGMIGGSSTGSGPGGGGSAFVDPTEIGAVAQSSITQDASGNGALALTPLLCAPGLASAPGAPTKVAATSGIPGSGTATVTWAAPTLTGGIPVLSYVAKATDTTNPSDATSGLTCTTTSLATCTFTGLRFGHSYTFSVTATNTVGQSQASLPSNSVTPSTTPDAPNGVTAISGNAQATVQWSSGFDGGSLITSATATATDLSDANSPTNGANCTTSSQSCVVTGLTNGDRYTFQVIQSNANGASSASLPSQPVVPAVPLTLADILLLPTTSPITIGQPLSSSALTGGVGAVPGVFSFDQPALIPPQGSYNAAVTFTPASPTYSSVAFTIPVQVNGPPLSPTLLTATPTNAQVALTWAPPLSDGGATINGYTVTLSPNSGSCDVVALTALCSGLSNGITYTFTVRAANGFGPGPEASTSATPYTAPSAPSSVTAIPGNGQASVSWLSPTSDGGSPITGYAVSSVPSGATCVTSSLTALCSGLINGTPYTFSVVARNAAGDSVAAMSNTATPDVVPSAPVGVTAVSGNSQVSVRWLAPAPNGGTPVTAYTVTSAPGGKTCSTSVSLTCVVTELTNGTSYTFSVVARNAAGDSVAATSNTATPMTVPGVPTRAAVSFPGRGLAKFSWFPPAANGGSRITRYEYCQAACSRTTSWKSAGLSGAIPKRTVTLVRFVKGRNYVIQIRAVNMAGSSRPVTVSFKQKL